jgi:hypothetical protein
VQRVSSRQVRQGWTTLIARLDIATLRLRVLIWRRLDLGEQITADRGGGIANKLKRPTTVTAGRVASHKKTGRIRAHRGDQSTAELRLSRGHAVLAKLRHLKVAVHEGAHVAAGRISES